MIIIDWANEFPSPVTITDTNGDIIYMNDKSIEEFKDNGGENLIGTNLRDCHNPVSNRIIDDIKSTHRPNTYIVEKSGQRKLIHQSPYFENKQYAGLVEISILLPDNMNEIKRD